MNKKMLCVRCESVDRKPKEGKHKIIRDGIIGYVCDDCIEEIDAEIQMQVYEIKEDEDTP